MGQNRQNPVQKYYVPWDRISTPTLHVRMGVNDCQSGMGRDEHSCTVQEHDDYCLRSVAKAKPTDLDSEENVLPTYK